MASAIDRLKRNARRLKGLVHALWIAQRDPRTPGIARIVAICVVAYAFSPIDLVPDPIPLLGLLDDLILLPLGIALAVRLIPAPVWAEARAAADRIDPGATPGRWMVGGIIVAIWIALVIGAALLLRGWR